MKELQASGEDPPQVRLVTASGADLTREIADADGFVGGPLSAADLKAARKLRWVQSFSAGVENQLFLSGNTTMRDSAIVLTNNRIVEGPELADHALRDASHVDAATASLYGEPDAGEVAGGPSGILVLKDKTAVVIGVGGAGFNIATRAWAFGMNVIGVDPEDLSVHTYHQEVCEARSVGRSASAGGRSLRLRAAHRAKPSHDGQEGIRADETRLVFCGREPGRAVRYGRAGPCARFKASRRAGVDVIVSGTVAEGSSALEVQQRDHHAARGRAFRSGSGPDGRYRPREHQALRIRQATHQRGG